MRVGLSGWNGFLARKLRERTEIEWVNSTYGIDCYLHLGSPTFTEEQINAEQSRVMHEYVKSSMALIDSLSVPIIFGSTTGVDDIQYDHTGSTSYNLSKLFLENYIVNHCKEYTILRIGSIISSRLEDVQMMKPDRLQQQILARNYRNVPMLDNYLDVDVFVNTTIDCIQNSKRGIINYKLQQMSMVSMTTLVKK